jgi:ribosomal protein S18 acetylase RimI-like enzyme
MIRLARADDLAGVHAIYMHPDVVPFLGVDPMPLEAFGDVFAGLCAGATFLVLEQDGRVAGFCRVTRHAGRAAHVAYLGTFALAPAVHGRGLARAFLEHVVAQLEAQGVRRVELMVEADNAHAIAFYRRLGFEHEGTLRAAYKRAGQAHYVDELLMGRLLEELPRLG